MKCASVLKKISSSTTSHKTRIFYSLFKPPMLKLTTFFIVLLNGCASNLRRPSELSSEPPRFYGLSLESKELVNTEDKNFNVSLDSCLTPKGEEFKCVVIFSEDFWHQQEYVIEIEEALNGCSD